MTEVKMLARMFLFVAAAWMASWGGALAQTPFAELARRDAQAVHDLLLENHPGPVDRQNPAFGEWLQRGLDQALTEADTVVDFPGYRNALRRYVNGFRDGHIALVLRADTLNRAWPGFTVWRDNEGGFRVAMSEIPEAPEGAEVTSCDGAALADRFNSDIAPLYWNADIPHEVGYAAPRLFMLDQDQPRPRACTFRNSEVTHEITLNWRTISREAANERVRAALGRATPALGVREVGGVNFVSMPSMNVAAVPDSFFADLESRLATLRTAPVVVLDVRGNAGGSSTIGQRALNILFGQAMVERIAASFDWTVDWRASPGNATALRSQNRDWGELDMPGAMDAAASRGDAFVRETDTPRRLRGRMSRPPFAGRVFLLTDGACASACLDFVDIARRLPGVTHVGLPTSADAIYIDNRQEILPSRLAALSFGMKVYRNRVRGDNEWYEPQIRWPGGPMTDEAIAAWVRTLIAR